MSNELVKLRGKPTGPEVFISALGCATRKFKEPTKNTLDYHVPLEMRGEYRKQELANYDPSFKYRIDPYGMVLCVAQTKAQKICSNRATNRTPFCTMHGGALHPLDRPYRNKVIDDPNELSRYEQFKHGIITADDLDDEELATCAFRNRAGGLYAPRNLPREIVQEFQRALYHRANIELKKHTIEAVRIQAEIMKSTAVDPETRLKASQFLIERNLGKTPQVIALTTQQPWEEVFDDIITTNANTTGANAAPIIDAEVIDSIEAAPKTPDTENPNTIGPDDSSTESQSKVSLEARNGIPYTPMPIPEAPTEPQLTPQQAARNRNPAILAQEYEVKEFQYDLMDHGAKVRAAQRKRFIARALAKANIEDIHKPLIRKTIKTAKGTFVKWVDP